VVFEGTSTWFSARGGIRRVKIQSSTYLAPVIAHMYLNRTTYYIFILCSYITTVAVYFNACAYLLYFIIITNGGGVRDRRLTGPICTRAYRVPTLRPLQSCQSREKRRRPMQDGYAVERLTRPDDDDDDDGRGIPSRLECIFLLFGFVSLTVSLTLHRPYTTTSRMLLLHIRRRSVNNGRSRLYNTIRTYYYLYI